MWNSRNIQHKVQTKELRDQSTENGTENPSSRTGLERYLCRRLCHPGTRTPLHCRPASGGQPLYSPDRKQVLAVNGEIYNHRDIRAKYAGKYDFRPEATVKSFLPFTKIKASTFSKISAVSSPSSFMMRKRTISSLPAIPSESFLYI